MGARIVDEREHRRGLILGLTLAEVLLLLLFLMMLAFSIPLKRQIQAYQEAAKELQALRNDIRELEPWLQKYTQDQTGSIPDLSRLIRIGYQVERTLPDTDSSLLAEIFALLKPFLTDPARAQELKAFLQMAVAVDPNDPPASLRRANVLVKMLGANITPESLSALAPLLQDEKKLREFQAIYKEAQRINPDDPPAVLRERLKTAGSPPVPEHLVVIARGLATMDGLPPDPSKVEELLRAGMNAQSRGEHNWPPIIPLNEADGYYFKKGSAELADGFEQKLRDIVVPLVVRRAQEYKVDTIEVLGHTDEQALAQDRTSTLDRNVINVLNSDAPVSLLKPADNAGLGLARAVAVVKALVSDHRLDALRILPLSGAQLIGVDERGTKGAPGDIKERRRIEIRLRRSQPNVSAQAQQGR